MQSIWRKHLIICLFLGLLAIPIYFLDLAFTEEGGGNWITLDFRGLDREFLYPSSSFPRGAAKA